MAITGSLPKKADNPAVPVTVTERVESTHEAFESGATLVHLHVRNDDGSPSSAPERFSQVLEGIRRHCPGIITQVSTGGRSGAGKERGGMLQLKPDMASLATGSVNFPARVYDNAPDLVDWLASEMKAHGVKPEVEAFDLLGRTLRGPGRVSAGISSRWSDGHSNSGGTPERGSKTTFAWTRIRGSAAALPRTADFRAAGSPQPPATA